MDVGEVWEWGCRRTAVRTRQSSAVRYRKALVSSFILLKAKIETIVYLKSKAASTESHCGLTLILRNRELVCA